MTNKKEDHVVASYIEWNELNALYGRLLTILEAIGALPEEESMAYAGTTTIPMKNAKREAIKSLISDAVFSQDYKGLAITESEMEQLKKFTYYETE